MFVFRVCEWEWVLFAWIVEQQRDALSSNRTTVYNSFPLHRVVFLDALIFPNTLPL